jgi:hypothetical protein
MIRMSHSGKLYTGLTAGGRAPLLRALRAPQASNDIIELRIPSSERGQRVRVTATNVPALTAQVDQLLIEFVAQLRDLQVAHFGTVHKDSTELPSRLSTQKRLVRACPRTNASREPDGVPGRTSGRILGLSYDVSTARLSWEFGQHR